MTINSFQKKYKNSLAKFNEETFEKNWIKILEDIMAEVDAEGDYSYIRYSAVFSKKEWEEFSKHPERISYKAKSISLPKTSDKRFDTLLEIVNDSIELINLIKNKAIKDELKLTTASLLSSAIGSKYDIEIMRIADEYMGRSVEDRDNGIVNPTALSLNRLQFAIKEYANSVGIDHKILEKEIFAICEGRVSLLGEYFGTCDVDLETRKKILGIFDILRRDKTLAYEDVQLGWQMWKRIRQKTNLDLEKILELNSYPSFKTIKKRLSDFLNNPQFAKEMELHMKDELPKAYKFYKKNGYVEFDDLIAEEAEVKRFPKKLKTLEESEQMIKESMTEVSKVIPLLKKNDAKNIILNPIHPESNRRAFQSSTLNKDKNRVSVIFMTPRASNKDDYLQTLAHEAAHAIHRIILEKAEKAKIIAEGVTGKILGGVMEEFSLLVDSKFTVKKAGDMEKKYHGKEFGDFMRGISMRHQAPFGMIQLEIRKFYDELWEKGQRDELKTEQISELENSLEKLVHEWYAAGLKIKRRRLSSLTLFRVERIDDGLVYLKKYLSSNVVRHTSYDKKTDNRKLKTDNKRSDIKTAFNKRFGDDWIKKQDARAMMMWLMLETGRNQKTEMYDELIMNKDVRECYEELDTIGIERKDI